MESKSISRCSAQNYTNVGPMKIPNLVFKLLNNAAQLDPLPPTDKMLATSVQQHKFPFKKSMAEKRKEKLQQYFLQTQKAEQIINGEVTIRKPARQDGETYYFERRPVNRRPLKIDPAKCYCSRPRNVVWCLMCGYLMKGNVKVTCPLHPEKINVCENEMTKCCNPKCQALNHLKELDL